MNKPIDTSKLFAHDYDKKGVDYDKMAEEWGAEHGLKYKKLVASDRYKADQMIDRIAYYLKHKPGYAEAFEKSSGVKVSELKFRY